MKKWRVLFDGAEGGCVYAESQAEARKLARASYQRVFPGRAEAGQVRVPGPPEELDAEVAEAGRVVGAVYEGLRLLPGMEVPAEKLRGVLLLLEQAAAKQGLVSSRAAGGGDEELLAALSPVLEAKTVPPRVKTLLRAQVEWVGLNTPAEQRSQVELRLFQTLWEAGLVDLRFAESSPCKLLDASAFLAQRLTRAGLLEIQRFPQAHDAEAFREALQPYGEGAANLTWAFCPDREEAPVSVCRPLVRVGERILQPALLRRGIPQADSEAVALDEALFDVLDRLELWSASLGRLAEALFKETQRSLLARALTRIEGARKKMSEAAKQGEAVIPPETGRRDLIKFVIDQVHRLEDALALLPDRLLRDAFGELVFKDVVFRGAGAYLSQRFGINIDTQVVEGADTEALTGRYKRQPGGPKRRAKTTRIHSVVVPCYVQDGVAIRPASVRTGLLEL